MTTTSDPPQLAVAPPTTGRVLRRVHAKETWDRRRVRFWGSVVLGVQFTLMLAWNALEIHRYDLTWDFAEFYHVWYATWHGTLTTPLWRGEAVFITWPLGLLSLVNSSPLTLLSIQDIATVGAEVVAFYWLTEIAWGQDRLSPRLLSWLGLLLLVVNPWIYWAISFDYHSEAIGCFFAILAAHALFRNQKRAWIWVALTLASGLVTATYIFGIGLSRLLKRGNGWYLGIVACVVSVAWIALLVHLGAGGGMFNTNIGRTLFTPGALTVSSPQHLVSEVVNQISAVVRNDWFNRGDFVANLAPQGIFGALATPAIGITAVVLGVNESQTGSPIVPPSMQSIFVYVILPIGTVVVLVWLAKRFTPRVVKALMVLTAVNVLLWSVIWMPHLPRQWLTTSASSAAVIGQAAAHIPSNAEVLVSQGIVGAFGSRPQFVGLTVDPPWTVRVSGKDVWCIVTPHQGVETESVMGEYDIIDTLANKLHATIVVYSNDVWVFKWHRPPSVNKIQFGPINRRYPAWLFPSIGGIMRNGPRSRWYLAASGKEGYLLWGDEWREQKGHYVAEVTFKSSGPGPISIQVWNDSVNRELASKQYTRTNGIIQASLPVSVGHGQSNVSWPGSGPFRIDPQPSQPGQQVEIRIWDAKGVSASVYSISMRLVR